MLTPSEIQDKQFKTGLGFDKKDVEQFLHDISSDFDALLQENSDLKGKLKEMNESLAYYKSIEKTLQKALILAEKTAQDTRATALKEAEAIEMEARNKASQILAEKKNQIELYEHKIMNLMQQYDIYKIHFENLLHSQLELLNSKSFSINTDDFTYKESCEQQKQVSGKVASENLQQSMAAVEDEAAAAFQAQEDADQLQFDFLDKERETKSYRTDDGFEFFTMKDE
jgi:cell division initiation protein